MEAVHENIRIQRWILGVGVVLFGLKVAAWLLTNSVAILTDALESTVNIVSAAFGLYSLHLAAIPRDANHPYGHGKAEFLSAAVEGTLIGVAGGMIIWESVHRLLVYEPVTRLDTGLLLVGAAGAINLFVGLIAVRIGRRNHSLALESSGRHLMSDAWSTAGILVGLFAVILTGWSWLDAVVAMVFGVIILVTGYRILRKSVAGIMDEADEALLRELIEHLNAHRHQGWVDIHNLRIIKYGSVLHIDAHLTVPWYFDVRQSHTEVDALEAEVVRRYGDRVELFVHTDPCRPTACPICPIEDCTRRQKPFVSRLEWTLENVRSNDRHVLGTDTPS